jgi:hypothetical protein
MKAEIIQSRQSNSSPISHAGQFSVMSDDLSAIQQFKFIPD